MSLFWLKYLKLNCSFGKKSELKLGNYSDWYFGKLCHMAKRQWTRVLGLHVVDI